MRLAEIDWAKAEREIAEGKVEWKVVNGKRTRCYTLPVLRREHDLGPEALGGDEDQPQDVVSPSAGEG